MRSLAPVTLFVYNRLEHTKQTISALKDNELAGESDLYVYSDAPKNDEAADAVEAVRQYIKGVTGFKSLKIMERETNYGLAKSIIDGVTRIINEHGKVIVLEDDLVTSKYFLTYMNDSLDTYKRCDQVASIHGYFYPIENMPESFFIKGADCWGWATWKDRWQLFEADGQKLLDQLTSRTLINEINFNNSFKYTDMLKQQIKGENNSWAVRWYISMFLLGKLTLYPGSSLVKNIGFDAEGTHCSVEGDHFQVSLNKKRISNKKINIKECLDSRKKMELFFLSIKPDMSWRIRRKISQLRKIVF